MKRIGHILERVVDRENLRLAFWKASRGKRCRADQQSFARQLDENLDRLRIGIVDGTYPVGRYHRFTIHDPKEREICAAAFGERVLHHAIMNICEPYFEKWFIDQTCACRKNRGQKSAIGMARKYSSCFEWYLKCDIRKYFDSIPHDRLRSLLAAKFKDPYLLGWFSRLISTYETMPGRGLPIGNLTSQHFANLYLDRLDRFVLNRCGIVSDATFGYVRYMDDFIIWSDDKKLLLEFRKRIGSMLEEELSLVFKQSPIVQRTERGMDFLGLRIFPHTVRVSRQSLVRFRRKSQYYEYLHLIGKWDENELQRRMTALTAFLEQADSLEWRRRQLGIPKSLVIDATNRAPTGFNAVAAGTTTRTTALRRTATTTTRRTGTTTTASAPPAPQHHPARRMIPVDDQSTSDCGENTSSGSVSSSAEHSAGAIFLKGDKS